MKISTVSIVNILFRFNMKNSLCSAEESSVIWAEPHNRSSAKQFGQTERSVDHYYMGQVGCGVSLIVGQNHSYTINVYSSDRPNVRFGRTVRPNFYCAVRPK